jgi:hypothetical protein
MLAMSSPAYPELPAFPELGYKKTTARVTFEASSIWIEGAGPVRSATIVVKGEINRDTVLLVKAYYDLLMKIGAINLDLDTSGGNVESALEIGRFARENDLNVMVPPNAVCASACVFILAGGVTRYVEGKVGIHRPYIETLNVPATLDLVKQRAKATKEVLQSYFREMNLSERLADDMMMIPSDKILWLDKREIAAYGLGEDDPVIKETRTLKAAQKYGLSRAEYERRRQRAQSLCPLFTPPECTENVMRAP